MWKRVSDGCFLSHCLLLMYFILLTTWKADDVTKANPGWSSSHTNSTRMSCEVAKLLSPVAPLCGTIDKVVSAVLSISYTAGKKELNGLEQIYMSTSFHHHVKTGLWWLFFKVDLVPLSGPIGAYCWCTSDCLLTTWKSGYVTNKG